jgi:hypothetical protein
MCLIPDLLHRLKIYFKDNSKSPVFCLKNVTNLKIFLSLIVLFNPHQGSFATFQNAYTVGAKLKPVQW